MQKQQKQSATSQNSEKFTQENKKICVITSDADPFDHIMREGSSAMIGLAERLAMQDIDVTLYVATTEAPTQKELENLKKHYEAFYRINLEYYQISPENIHSYTNIEYLSYGIFEYLKNHMFDCIYFPLEGGIAYYSLLAKETGVQFLNTAITVVAHAPLEWASEADRFFFQKIEQAKVAFMERYCASQADRIICINPDLPDWFKKKNWEITHNCRVLPALTPMEWHNDPLRQPYANSTETKELVLIAGGRFRDGATLFADMLDELHKLGTTAVNVTIFGEFFKILGEHSGGFFVRRGRRWPGKISLRPSMALMEGIRYASHKDCIAVIPAFESATGATIGECIRRNVKFVSTAVGGNLEQVLEKHHSLALAQPNATALASLVQKAMCKPERVFPKFDEAEKTGMWLAHYRETVTKNIRATKKKKPGKISPLVSVVIAHHDRPQYLAQLISSIREQDYPNFEVILVDDGSKLPESHLALKMIEEEFSGKNWKIIRSENRYVGAARNLGVKSSRGDLIIFVDDDNALFPNAISTFVSAIERSGSDVCMAMARSFYDVYIPSSTENSYMSYIPLGGSLDVGFLTNCFGDTISIYRRSIFEKVGYQLEKFGYMVEDHEFFVRIALAGLKMRLIPECLFWYRVSTRGRYRSSHYYDNQIPITEAYQKNNFSGMNYIYQLFLGQNMGKWQTESFKANLYYSPADRNYLKLSEFEPNSREAFELLSMIAANEGRQDTAMSLLAEETTGIDFVKRAEAITTTNEQTDAILSRQYSPVVTSRRIKQREYKLAKIYSGDPGKAPLPSFADTQDNFFLEAEDGFVSIAVLPAACPVSTISATCKVSIAEYGTGAGECLVMICAMYDDPVIAVEAASALGIEGSSGWLPVSDGNAATTIVAGLEFPSQTPQNLIFAIRTATNKPQKILGHFFDTTVQSSAESPVVGSPIGKAPVLKHRMRQWTEDERRSARLITDNHSELPLLLFPKTLEDGLFLRPAENGPVVAIIDRIFPAFANSVTARVEIAHDEGGPFEFAVAIVPPDGQMIWQKAGPLDKFAFSGWIKVSERHVFHELTAKLSDKVPAHLSVAIAVRLPNGSSPSPANSYFRNLSFYWNE
jgi:glycosyltransferase involved in cell wall biosynthesis